MQDVLNAEADAERLEAAVYAEMVRLQSLRKEVDGYLTRARRMAEDSQLRSFLDGVSVPQPSIDQPLNDARTARLKAVEARKASITVIATRLDAHQHELEKLAEKMKEEEAAAKQRASKQAAAEKAKEEEKKQEAPREELAEVVSAFSYATDDTLIAKPKAQQPQKAQPPAAATVITPAVKPAAAPTKDERRVAQRIALCTEISLGSESNFFTGFTGDISEGGVFMATVEVMPVGTQVEVSFTLPTGAKIEAKGEVRWVREIDILNPDQFPGMGIQFTQVPNSSLAAITSFASEREPMFFPD